MTRRWSGQRWLLDNTVRAVGVDWNQPRTIRYNAPCGPEAIADFAAIRARAQARLLPALCGARRSSHRSGVGAVSGQGTARLKLTRWMGLGVTSGTAR